MRRRICTDTSVVEALTKNSACMNKKFDAVQLMRQVRDKMSADMQDMSFEEQRVYIEKHASKVREELGLRHEAIASQERK